MTEDHEKTEERAGQASADQQTDAGSDNAEGSDEVQYRRWVPITLALLPLLVLVVGLLYSPSEESEIFTSPTPEPPPSTAPGIFRPAARQQATMAPEEASAEHPADQTETGESDSEAADELPQVAVSEGTGSGLGQTTRPAETESGPEPGSEPDNAP